MARTGWSNPWSSSVRATASALVFLLAVVPGCAHRRLPLLSPAMALQVMEADRRLNDRGNATLDVALQDRHETGAAAQIDDAEYGQLQASGKTSEPGGALQESEPRAFVPLQYGYPAEFLGEWSVSSTGGSKGTYIELYVRPTPADPWKVTLYVYAPSTDPVPDVAVGKDEYAETLSPLEVARLSTSPDHLADDLAT